MIYTPVANFGTHPLSVENENLDSKNWVTIPYIKLEC